MKLQITIDGKTYQVEVEVLDDEEANGESRSGARPAARITDSHAQEAWDSEEKVCRSPVMGLVVTVNVTPGQTVEAGELMLVLEAMKMETKVTAPRAGIVASIGVKPGEPVKLNQMLLEME